jgi:hypothetical protein
VGKANEARECAPDGVPTNNHHMFETRRWARRKRAFAHPTVP